MPYIPQNRRDIIDMDIDELVWSLRDLDPTKGDLNYTVCRVVLGALKPESGWSYHSLSAAIGALKDAAVEIERRMLGPYEDTCIERNGDLEELQ